MHLLSIALLLSLAHLCFSSELYQKICQHNHARSTDILHCNTEQARKTARSMEIFTRIFDLENPEQMENFYEFKFYHSTIFLNLQCNESRAVLEEISRRNLFNASRYFVLHGTENLDEAQEFLNGQNIKINSKIQILIRDQLYEATSPELWAGSKLSVNFVKNFSRTEVGQKMKGKAFDMEGAVGYVIVLLPKVPPGNTFLEYIQGHDRSHRDNLFRWGVPIVNLVAEMWNFKVHFVKSTSPGYPKADNKTFDGVLGAFQRGVGNLSTSGITYVSYRIPIMESGFSVTRFREMFIFRHPTHGKGVKSLRNIFLMPLSNEVWMSLGIATALSMVVLFFVYRNEKVNDAGIKAATNMVAIMSQQDVSMDSVSTLKSKLVVFTFFVTTFVCWQYYSATIVGSLLTPTPRTINNLNTLSNSDLKIYLEAANVSVKVFQISSDADTINIYQKRIKDNVNFKSLDEGLALVQQGGNAFFTFVDYSYDLIKERFSAFEIDDLQEVTIYPQTLKSFLYFPVPKFSAYKELMRVGVLRTIEVGLASYWEKRWKSKQPLGNLEQNKVAKVDFARFSTCLYVLCVGILISLLIFVGELLHHRFTNRQ